MFPLPPLPVLSSNKPLAPQAKAPAAAPIAAVAKKAFKRVAGSAYSSPSREEKEDQVIKLTKRPSSSPLASPKRAKEDESTVSDSSSSLATAAAAAPVAESSGEELLWNILEERIDELVEKAPHLREYKTVQKHQLQQDIVDISKELQETVRQLKGRIKRWPTAPVSKTMETLFQERATPKVVFVVEGKEIFADKFVLDQSTCSQFFAPLYQNNPIVINDCSVSSFECFLRYIYTHDIKIPKEELLQLLHIAHQFNAAPLVEECKGILENLPLIEKAFLLPEAPLSLINSALFERVMETPWSLLPALPYLSLNTLLGFLENDRFAFDNERQAILLVTAWLLCHPTTPEEKQELKKHIRHGLLSYEDLFGHISSLGFYSDAELGAIGKAIAKPPENKHELKAYRPRNKALSQPLFGGSNQFKVKREGSSLILSGWASQFPFIESFEDSKGSKFLFKIEVNEKGTLSLEKEGGASEPQYQVHTYATTKGATGFKKEKTLVLQEQETTLAQLKILDNFKGIAFLVILTT